MGKNGVKLDMHDTPVTGVNIQPRKVKNPNQAMPITAKVKQSLGGSKLKN